MIVVYPEGTWYTYVDAWRKARPQLEPHHLLAGRAAGPPTHAGCVAGIANSLRRLSCLGHQASDYCVHAHDLPEGWGIERLIGLGFLRQLNYEIRSIEGRILVERAAP